MNRLVSVLESLINHRRRLGWLLGAFMLALVVVDLFKTGGYKRFPWDSIPAFTALYAFLASLALIGLAKGLGYALLYRSEDYYGEGRDE